MAAKRQVKLEGDKQKIYHTARDGTVSVLRYRRVREGGKVRRMLIGSVSLSPPRKD